MVTKYPTAETKPINFGLRVLKREYYEQKNETSCVILERY